MVFSESFRPSVERDSQRAEERIRKAAWKVGAGSPKIASLALGFSALVAEACSPVAMPPVMPEVPVSVRPEVKGRSIPEAPRPQKTEFQEKDEAIYVLMGVFTDPRLSAEERKRVAEELLGETHSQAEWHAERERKLHGGREGIGHAELLPVPSSALERVMDVLPRTWIHPSTQRIDFFTQTDFLKKYPESAWTEEVDEKKTDWKIACINEFGGDRQSRIECNTDVMRTFGFSEQVKNVLFHEFGHGADPRRLPLPVQVKVDLWRMNAELLATGDGPRSGYIEMKQRDLEKDPDKAAGFSLLQREAWAERMETVFLTSEKTRGASSWETYQVAYEEALMKAPYFASASGAHRTFELVKAYFEAVEPTYEPWTMAKSLPSILAKLDGAVRPQKFQKISRR